MKKNYYLDTCIWLNLFKKEVSLTEKIPYWKIVLDIIESIVKANGIIYVSTIVLKELYFISPENFKQITRYFKQSDFIKLIKTTPEDYNLARTFEKEDGAKISFYDYLHIAIVKRLSCVFVTRDKDLIKFSENKINVTVPENLIN